LIGGDLLRMCCWRGTGFGLCQTSASTGEAPCGTVIRVVKPDTAGAVLHGHVGAAAGLAGMFRGRKAPQGQITNRFQRRLRVHRDNRPPFLWGGCNPVGILLAVALMALTYIGGDIAQKPVGLPRRRHSSVFQVDAAVLACLAFDLFTHYRAGVLAGRRS